ncbi:MAG: hypothetical protein E7057_03035 [Lentisphaerae bacterium]|nr:hypothetical protein [Lentisphaerota bacterium]
MKIPGEQISSTPDPNQLFAPVTEKFPLEKLPEAVYEDDPGVVELYREAWRIAWSHVYNSCEMPFSPYLGEGCCTNKVWIWDSCFMALWGCYANDVYPVANTLDNFYAVISGKECGIKVHHPDNPPLFGWAELELYRHTGNRERVEKLISGKVLQNYYKWRENSAAPGDYLPWSGTAPVMLRRLPNGYLWSGNPSGMDNTPRGRGSYQMMLWVDALAQQGMFARDVAELCMIAGKMDEAAWFMEQYESKKQLICNYFDPEDGCFYDRTLSRPGFGGFIKVLTPASFWPVFAQMSTPEQTGAMVKTLLDPEKLGGVVACPSVSRSDPDFDPAGGYWRGGVWLPVFYMTMKALGKVGENALARKLSLQMIHWMKECFDQVEPHTIWECYSPTEPLPSTTKSGLFCRKDFCGWSALAPISLLIEDVIGLNKVDAANMSICWNPPATQGKCGIRNLKLGGNTVSLVTAGGIAEVENTLTLNLTLNGTEHRLAPGRHTVKISL